MKSSQQLSIAITATILPFLSSCGEAQAPAVNPGFQQQAPVVSNTNTTLPQLSAAQKRKIGNKIWKNESGGKVSGLTAWNTGEEFPSLGIGHFIWYPRNYRGPFTESFPAFVNYAKRSGAKGIPAWVLSTPVCPWNSRAAFLADMNGARLKNLRTFLAANVTLQTDFIMQKSRAALTKMLAVAPAGDRQRIQANYAKVASTANGTYALIDYVNFKGEGINPSERYNGQGWGLLQVLQGMNNTASGQAAAREFSASAKRTLDRRIKHSPSSRGETRWRAGWHSRCNTYARAL